MMTQRLLLPMKEHWAYISKHVPRPPWPPSARKDPWHRHPELNPRVVFDRSYHVVLDEESVFFASLSDDLLS